MHALELIDDWPVVSVSAAALVYDGAGARIRTHRRGDSEQSYRIASITKPITAWAVLVAVEEGLLELDSPLGQPGCTLRHLLSHAGGYPFDGPTPIAAPGTRRIYSNTGIEMAADAVVAASGMPFVEYLTEAVLAPLGMSATELRGSPAHALWSSLDDLCRFADELVHPRLLAEATARLAEYPVFADLAGIVPGLGRYERCSWGLGLEVKGDKDPHWTGPTNSAATFGHFGGSGTLLWVDRGATSEGAVACIALTDRPFDEWAVDALVFWPALSDAVLRDTITGAGS